MNHARTGRTVASHSEFAYERLKDEILSGRIAPRTRLVEQELASELGVSRTPIREALRRLISQGFVSRHQAGGLVVHELSSREVDDIYQIREMLDGLAARLAAQRSVDSDLVRLEAALGKLAELATNLDESDDRERVELMVSADLTFHEILHDASGNERLRRLSVELSDSVRLVSLGAFTSPERARAIVTEHESVLAALRDRDPDAAEQAARQHVRSARQYLSAQLLAIP
jgi:DNA-binding GntR family transcriptional regulator